VLSHTADYVIGKDIWHAKKLVLLMTEGSLPEQVKGENQARVWLETCYLN